MVKFLRSAIMYDGSEIVRDYSMQDLSNIAQKDVARRMEKQSTD